MKLWHTYFRIKFYYDQFDVSPMYTIIIFKCDRFGGLIYFLMHPLLPTFGKLWHSTVLWTFVYVPNCSLISVYIVLLATYLTRSANLPTGLYILASEISFF